MPQPKKTKSIEESLWSCCDKLRGGVETQNYKHVVLSLIFLKFIGDTFEERRAELITEGNEKFIDVVDFYTMKNVFYLPEEARWSYIVKNSSKPNITSIIDSAMDIIEKNNKSLKGALPKNFFSNLNIEVSKLKKLIDDINNNIDTQADKSHDLIGRIYEYFLKKFAIAEGKGKGEFYTPKSVVNLIAEMIQPWSGIIYDPCCGSGGMFVQSLKFVEAHQGNTKDIAVFGQESMDSTYKLAKMNLAIRGITGDLGEIAADTFSKDQHPDLKVDYIMANPPFNLKDWRGENELKNDPRWTGYDVPPASNANYGWILHMISKLKKDKGVAGFLLANGALNDPDTKSIRKRIIENNLVEAIIVLPRNTFYSTDISVTLWIINKNKKAHAGNIGEKKVNFRDREDEILFMDLRQWGSEFDKKYIELTSEDIKKASEVYHGWQCEDNSYKDIPEFCRSVKKSEVAKNDYSLVPSRYIEFVDKTDSIDYASEMSSIKEEIMDILNNESRASGLLKDAIEGVLS